MGYRTSFLVVAALLALGGCAAPEGEPADTAPVEDVLPFAPTTTVPVTEPPTTATSRPVAPTTTAKPATTVPATTGTYYGSCDEVRAAGAAPIRRGEPGYRPGLDRDNDGIACDTEG